MAGSTDSWFVGFAPAISEIVFAVMVEGGGLGAKTAAADCSQTLGKAASLNYLK